MKHSHDNSDKHDELIRHPVALPPTDANGVDTGEESKLILQDAANYPEGWDMEEFKNLGSYAARGKYANEKLGKLGSGSARIVFEINPETVLKLARNKKGLAQNELEAEVAGTGWYDFVARVFDSEPNNLWIESEKAHKMTKAKFRQLTGFKFDDFNNYLRSKMEGRNGYLFRVNPEVSEMLDDDEFFNEVLGFVADYDILPGDFQRTSSWGWVDRDGHEQPILIDYGISRSIYNDFYVQKR